MSAFTVNLHYGWHTGERPAVVEVDWMSSGRRAGQRFDASHHVTTEALLFLGQLDPAAMGPSLEHATHYEATPLADFKALMAACPLAPEDACFVDIGSGMGRVVLLAARLPFRQVIGVEFSGALHEIARENLRAYSGQPLRCRDVRLVHGDAADYTFPPGDLVVFMYNPFSAPPLRRVLANLASQQPGDIVLLYHTPVHRAVIEDTGEFEIVAGMRAGVVYRRAPRSVH